MARRRPSSSYNSQARAPPPVPWRCTATAAAAAFLACAPRPSSGPAPYKTRQPSLSFSLLLAPAAPRSSRLAQRRRRPSLCRCAAPLRPWSKPPPPRRSPLRDEAGAPLLVVVKSPECRGPREEQSHRPSSVRPIRRPGAQPNEAARATSFAELPRLFSTTRRRQSTAGSAPPARSPEPAISSVRRAPNSGRNPSAPSPMRTPA
ncbi:hypothetical protein SETIT_7G279000v2 [Setaria italica]|uniref:Uncharacterized protein n=1 Tax=Setaria italica TaxID=4555 RepID=A0A368S0K8_SETIT|nr:hypothetical protein SETIT_7G279000v2 [Setaria italica]